jgi:DNA (cytosine-5)-methyltransferase 1
LFTTLSRNVLKKYKVTDLFSGCGGLSLGFVNSGFSINQAFELDEFACKTYARNLKVEPICGDIGLVNDSEFKKTDVLLGGFPCQPFSLSGLQQGFFSKDGEGFSQCIRAIKLTNPTVVILENVTGFKRLHGGIFHDLAIREIASLGYNVTSFELNSKDFQVPQSRTRLFMVATNNGSGITPPTPSSKAPISVKTAIDDLVGKEGKYPNHEPMKHTQRIVERFAGTLPGESTRQAMDRDPTLGSAKITNQCYRRLEADKPAPTLVANFVTTTVHYTENRNITAREGARIQSFPDDFIFEGLKTRMSWQHGLSQFEQIGNAVPPKVAEALAKMTIALLAGTPKGTVNDHLTQGDLFGDLDSRYEAVMIKINNKQKAPGTRGRTSKFQSFYRATEGLVSGEELSLPDGVLDNKIFLDAAMRRRKIKFEIEIRDNDKKVFKKL